MGVDQVVRLIDALASLLGVLVWPAVLVFFLVRFRRPFASFLGNLGELSFKAPGVEATARRREEAAAAAALAAAGDRSRADDGGQEAPVDPREVVNALPSPRAQRRIEGARVLWVDDRPGNNHYERQALEALGLRIQQSTSTGDALSRIESGSFNLIISDMDRPPDHEAGFTLLDQVRERGIHIPFVIYSSTSTMEKRDEARRHGAYGVTNWSGDLVNLVTAALTEAS